MQIHMCTVTYCLRSVRPIVPETLPLLPNPQKAHLVFQVDSSNSRLPQKLLLTYILLIATDLHPMNDKYCCPFPTLSPSEDPQCYEHGGDRPIASTLEGWMGLEQPEFGC